MFLRRVLAGKIHGAIVTDAHVEYMGSVTVDSELLKMAGILPLEQVEVWNMTTGARLTTYCLPGEPGSGTVQLNGAAARKASQGDRIIIASFAYLQDEAATRRRVTVVIPDEENRPRKVLNYVVSGSSDDWTYELQEVDASRMAS